MLHVQRLSMTFQEINSFDFKEIASTVLTYVPDIPYIDKLEEVLKGEA